MQPHINLPAPYMPHAGLIAAFEVCPLIAIMRGVTRMVWRLAATDKPCAQSKFTRRGIPAERSWTR